ncbi:MAG TPA: uracil-DNA glycosylase [Ignavibacteria bacterium]|nr:uracil-DNA glycosylase [Ignavibacteria bacterium]
MNDIADKIINKLQSLKNLNLKIYTSEIKSYNEFLNSKFDLSIPDLQELKIENADENVIKETVKEYMNKDKWMSANSLDELKEMICNCKKCDLWKTRTNFVFGSGNKNADLVIVGEAPGAEEDKQGLPFVGRAGKLLTQILESINFKREEVFICNVLKSRPPENRNPSPEEIKQCEPYLVKQLELIKPKMLLCLGTFAAQTLLQTKEALGKLRGKFHTYKNIPLLVTYHPAALLRNPNWKKPTWDDVQLLRKEFDKLVSR